jgi:hypothetical protein
MHRGRQDFEPIRPISKNKLTINFEAISAIMNHTRSGQFLAIHVLEMSYHSTALVIVLLPARRVNHSVAFNVHFVKPLLHLRRTRSVRIKGRIVCEHEGRVLPSIFQIHSNHVRIRIGRFSSRKIFWFRFFQRNCFLALQTTRVSAAINANNLLGVLLEEALIVQLQHALIVLLHVTFFRHTFWY